MPLTTIVNSTFPVLLQLFQVSSSCLALPRPALLCAHRIQFSSLPISHLAGALPVRLLLLQVHSQRSSLQLHRHSSAANYMGFISRAGAAGVTECSGGGGRAAEAGAEDLLERDLHGHPPAAAAGASVCRLDDLPAAGCAAARAAGAHGRVLLMMSEAPFCTVRGAVATAFCTLCMMRCLLAESRGLSMSPSIWHAWKRED